MTQKNRTDRNLKSVEKRRIPRDKFEASYQYDETTGLCQKRPVVVEAKELTENVEISVGWSDQKLIGRPGDFLLTYGPNDYGVVQRSIFFETYDVVEA
ncbi:MAG: hypothetical protein DI596_02940 [Azospira oryzae]|nr:MAG: hypothetical protein DI596_02940 [Azospira oryzae]PZP81973.1 MAG: hypothetical protein DI593_02940 [Azospira oryzae]